MESGRCKAAPVIGIGGTLDITESIRFRGLRPARPRFELRSGRRWTATWRRVAKATSLHRLPLPVEISRPKLLSPARLFPRPADLRGPGRGQRFAKRRELLPVFTSNTAAALSLSQMLLGSKA